MPLDFNVHKYFVDQGIHWDTAQKLLGWPTGRRRHALQRFVEGNGRLSRDEINDLLRYVHDHCPNWLDYISQPSILHMMSISGRIRMYIVGGSHADEQSDYSSMFDLLALSHINANLPRTTWRPVQCDIEPCRVSWVLRQTNTPAIISIDTVEPPEWKISFGSSKVSRATTMLLEQIFGREPAKPPSAEPVLFRLKPPPGRPLADTRFLELVSEEQQQGISIFGGRPFLYHLPDSPAHEKPGRDIGLIVCQSETSGLGGRVVIAGVSGPGTYAAAIAFVQCTNLFAPTTDKPVIEAHAGQRYHANPIIGIVEATVEHDVGESPSRIVRNARIVYCSNRPDITPEQGIPLRIPGQADTMLEEP